MTSHTPKPRVSRSIAWRLAAGVAPSILAVGLVVGLSYYGEIGRGIPTVLLSIAIALTVASAIIAWRNARYFAERVARLAEASVSVPESGRTDEFDRIERVVGNLGSALSASEAERARTNAAAAVQLREQATMLAGVAADAISQLDEVRLPLQILLESPFGELNENQEELLRDARAAADAIDGGLRRLSQLADIDRDAFVVQKELVQVNDVVRSVLPLARAAIERRGARVDSNLEPGLPRVIADRARLAEALALLVSGAAAEVERERSLEITTARDGQLAVVRIVPAGQASSDRTLASRLISAQGGEVAVDGNEVRIKIGG